MKQTLLIITALLLTIGYSQETDAKPIDGSTLVWKDGLYYASDSEEPYNGEAVSHYENGQKMYEGTYKDGKLDGFWTNWYENGQKESEATVKDGKEDGKRTAWIYGELYDLGYFPALTIGKNKVYGELIEFENPDILTRVDSLEGYRGENSIFNFYDRKEIQIFTDIETFTAWAYFLNKCKIIESDGELITSGVWLNYRY